MNYQLTEYELRPLSVYQSYNRTFFAKVRKKHTHSCLKCRKGMSISMGHLKRQLEVLNKVSLGECPYSKTVCRECLAKIKESRKRQKALTIARNVHIQNSIKRRENKRC